MFSANTRITAINSVEALLSNLPMHINKGNLEDAIRMVDREIGGLLGHPESPFVTVFRSNQQILFPGGLEKTCQGRDIIQVLNSHSVNVKNPRGETVAYALPKALKNPEKGIAQIVGVELAKKLFIIRGSILTALFEKDKNWKPNLEVNQKAEAVLLDYPYELAKNFTKDILKRAKAEIEKKRFLNSLEFLDSGIRSLLAQPQSKMSCSVKKYARLFSSRVSMPSKGNDLISLMHSETISSSGKESKSIAKSVEVPKELKNPEKGVLNILGSQLTNQLFTMRRHILQELSKQDPQWYCSLQANERAEQNVEETELYANQGRVDHLRF